MLTLRHLSLNPAASVKLTALLALLALLTACGSNDAGITHPGQTVMRANACASCHGADGSGGVGPSFVGLFGANVEIQDGDGVVSVVADEEYLRRSIIEPQAQIVAGYDLQMPTKNLDDAEVELIIDYIKSLTDETSTATTP